MKKLRALTLLVLMGLVVFFVCDQVGIVDYFNDVVNERNGWVKSSNGEYVKHITSVEWTYHYSILKDPKAKKDFQVYVGTMKKSAVDRMTHIIDDTVIMEDGESYDDLKDRLKLNCHYMNGNTVIINGESMSASVKTKRWGFSM